MDKLLQYFQQELSLVRYYGKEFALKYPKVAHHLGFVDGVTEDPHVERIIESFALLTSRINQRLDEYMPDQINSLLTVIAPQFLREYPSLSIMSIQPDIKNSGIDGLHIIPKGTQIYSKHSGDYPLTFRTVYPIEIQPITLEDTSLKFSSEDLCWHFLIGFNIWTGAKLTGDRLRVFLNGSDNVVNAIYSYLCTEISHINVISKGKVHVKTNCTVDQVGFAEDEGILGLEPRISEVHSLIQEYFFFPQKFHFLDINIPEHLRYQLDGDFQLEIVLKRSFLNENIDKISKLISSEFLCLNCAPIVNLFKHQTEPVVMSDEIAEYPIVTDLRRPRIIEVWSIDKVTGRYRDGNIIKEVHVPPLLGIDHYKKNQEGYYWQSFKRDVITDKGVTHGDFIAFSDVRGENKSPGLDIVNIDVTCTNTDTADLIEIGNSEGDFFSDIPIAGLKINALIRPTRPVASPKDSSLYWRVVSQLSLNYMIMGGDRSARNLREALLVYNYNDNAEVTRIINLIDAIDIKPVSARMDKKNPYSLARGISVVIGFNHKAVNEPGYYLFCHFLDRLIGLYAPVNSFTQLTSIIENEEYSKKIWPYRSGRLSWL